jgi:phospholipid/cholesterol/gamma-HCH transport system permease protein
MDIESMKHFIRQSREFMKDLMPTELTVELGGVSYLDSAGALALVRFEEEVRGNDILVTLQNLSEEARRVFDLVSQRAEERVPLIYGVTKINFFEQVGEASRQVLDDFVELMAFIGKLIRTLGNVVLHPRSVRWTDVLFYMKRAGVDGLPIVALISLLLGLIIAFMSALQLKQFGANIYVASLVGVSMVRELGPIMTAILVAGRSGSAFAAEIGTMIVNEEVDALTTMGFDPTMFLTIPKVIAAMIVVPVLTVYAALMGIVGGLIIGVTGLDLTVYTYVSQTMKSLDVFGIVSSLVKSSIFAVLIAGIGCQRGFKVRGGAEAVGLATTSAVVAGIFLVIVTDSAFAIMLHYIR